MERVSSVLVDQLDKVAVAGTLYRPVARLMGVSGFGVNAYTGEQPGDEVIEPHDETGMGSGHHEELYVVLTGHAEFELDGETLDAPAGALVFARPEQHRAAKALAADTTVLVIGGKPGAAGPPSPFEYWYLATPAYDAGDYERAYAIAAEGLERPPGQPVAELQPRLLRRSGRAARGRAAPPRGRVRRQPGDPRVGRRRLGPRLPRYLGRSSRACRRP